MIEKPISWRYNLKKKVSHETLYSKGKNDECYTPDYAVTAILEHIEIYKAIHVKKNNILTVWCPFDTLESEFVKQINTLENVNVVYSHIDNNQNFFDYEPEHFDIIISNPPFTNKRLYFERALSLKKPFALLMTMTWLNDGTVANTFKNHDLQLLSFNKRIHYKINNQISKNTTFLSAYFCINFLHKQIIFKTL